MQPWVEVSPGVRLTGDGAAWLVAEATVIVADLHIGYDLAARRRGGYLPNVGSAAEIAAALLEMMGRVAARRLVIAGDLRHSTRDLDDAERREVLSLGELLSREVELCVVRGNHDRGHSLIGAASLDVARVGDVDIVHEPPRVVPDRWTVCGHLHPRLTVRDEAGASARYSCALVTDRLLVLPAWSTWAGGVEAARLVRDLPPARWRALPMHDGLVGDLGIVFDARATPL